ncbi:CAP domain-containing protein [Streptomyces stramineus]|uniref:CAP domain-containing protein n=1 Tax=Streptomyces stramineus TaxID=173861 RepID=A0ABN1AW93_9ACTN
MNREPETPTFDPASDGTRRPRRRRGRRPRRAMVIAGTAGLIAVVGGGYGVAQSLSGGGGDSRTAAAAASEPAWDQPSGKSAEKSAGKSGEQPPAAVTAPSEKAHSASPSASASEAAAKEKAGDSKAGDDKKNQQEVRAEGGAGGGGEKSAARTPAQAKEAPSAENGNGSGSVRKPPARGGGAQAGGANGKHVQQVVDMVNAERAKAGCSPVTVNAKLQAAAQGHSDDMAARDYYAHTSPEGKSPGDRITAAGYRWSTYGENIFKSPKDARTAMDGWMKSEGHRANILNCSFKEIGVGINFKANGPWWTQNFGASS